MPTATPTRKRMAKAASLGGRPSLFQGASKRTINLTDAAIDKAKADAGVMGRTVSTSQAIEAAIRAYRAEPGPGTR